MTPPLPIIRVGDIDIAPEIYRRLAEQDSPLKHRPEVARIGRMIYDAGGRDAMVMFWDHYRHHEGIDLALELDVAWDGIEGWLA